MTVDIVAAISRANTRGKYWKNEFRIWPGRYIEKIKLKKENGGGGPQLCRRRRASTIEKPNSRSTLCIVSRHRDPIRSRLIRHIMRIPLDKGDPPTNELVSLPMPLESSNSFQAKPSLTGSRALQHSWQARSFAQQSGYPCDSINGQAKYCSASEKRMMLIGYGVKPYS